MALTQQQKHALQISEKDKALSVIIQQTRKNNTFLEDGITQKENASWGFDKFPIGVDASAYTNSYISTSEDNKGTLLEDALKIGDLKVGDYTLGTALENIVAEHFGDREPTESEYENIAKGMNLVDSMLVNLVSKANETDDPDKYLADSLGGLEGHEITPLEILTTFQFFLEAPVPEMIGMVTPIKSQGSDIYKVFNISQQVTQASGDLVEGDIYDVTTMGKPFALKGRHQSFTYRDADLIVGNEAVYYFTALQRKDDVTGTAIPINKTSLTVLRYENGSVNDFEKASIEGVCSPELVINGKTITMTINYATGEIIVKVKAGALQDGDKFIIQTQVNVSELEKDRGLTQPNITFSLYPTFEMSIGTHADAFKERTVLNQLGLGIMPYSEKLNLQKVISEFRETAFNISAGMARLWHKTIDLSSYPNTANHDIYQHIVSEIGLISTRMNVESGFSTGAYLIGGEALEAIMTKSKSIQRHTTLYNGVRPLGLLGGKFNSYFFPNYDKGNPLVDEFGNVNSDATKNVYSKILVLGTVNKQTDHLVIGAVNKPFRKENVGIDKNSQRYTMMEGEYMLRVNENPKTHFMVYELLVKGL